MSRTVVRGKPSPELKRLYQTVKDTALLTKVSVRLICDEGLRLYMAREHARNPDLLDVLEAMRKVRENKGGKP